MKYSVIIPVYKAEKTIKKCIESLLNQPHNDVEIIIINDGSPDKCGEICKKYTILHPCIKYIEKENGGVSSARNVGLREASGEYIVFVDSDDYVDKTYFATLDVYLDDMHPDMLLFGMKYVGKKRNNIWNTGSYIATEDVEIATKISNAMKKYLFSNLMSKVFNRKIIYENNLKFDEKISIGEDQLFVFQYALHVNKMASISDVLYYLVIDNEESLSRKRREYLADQLLRGSREMLSYLNCVQSSIGVWKVYYNAILWTHYRSAYSACKELQKFNMQSTERRKCIKEICKKFTIQELQPNNLTSWIIAFPVIYRMAFIIDILSLQRCKFKK